MSDMSSSDIETIDITQVEGLTTEEAERRFEKDGPNEIRSAMKRSILRIAFDVMVEPMFLLLVAVGVVYLFLPGELQEALILLSFVVVVIGITFYQERKTERALEALRDLSSPRALVIRDGDQKRIAGRDVVVGDLLILTEGDRVPADAVLIQCLSFQVDESLLTGESVPVRKSFCDGTTEMERPGGEGGPFLFSGTLVVKGYGVALVKAIGSGTEIGRIGKALEEIEPEDTPLQIETRKLVLRIASVGAGLSIMVFLVFGITRGHWLEAVIAGLTLAMAMLPEEFPVVLTLFLSTGAWRISKKDVLTRSVPAVETLGSASVLCVDKTGTLTFNRISVSRLVADGLSYDLADHTHADLPEELHELVEFAILASQRDPFDPLEKAMKRLGDRKLVKTEHLHDDWTLLREYPLSERLLALSHVWKSPDGNEYVIAAKGAPEAVGDLCHMSTEEREEMLATVANMASDGLRVIAVAKSHFVLADLPVDQHDFTFEFIGLIGLVDPVRPNVHDSIQECYTAGIRVVMITGDYPGTAQNVAYQIGLREPEEYITGHELEEMDDEQLKARIHTVNIFARVVPEQKLRIVNAFKANGHIVAMTGDGVNDAPALKSAQIGIAMGERGTDVAREAAALVLLNDDFSSIEHAVRLGRRIFENIKKAMAYILAVHVPIAGISLIPVLISSKLPLILLPVHIAFLELIIDPACSIVFEAEPEESDVMKRPPRDLTKPMFDKRTITISVAQGIVVMILVSLVFGMAHWRGLADGQARAIAFTALVIANLGLIMTNRSWTRTIKDTLKTPNKALWWVLGGTVVFLALILYVPALRHIFRFDQGGSGPLGAVDVMIAVGTGVLSVVWFEVYKVFRLRRAGRN
jgi:P-type Ca2+ transporter type 2C